MSAEALVVARELREREPLFHRREHGASRADFEIMIAADFWEVGASGRVYDRETCLDELERRYADPTYDPLAALEMSDFAVREAGDGVWLATYRLRQGQRDTLRLSVWRQTGRAWVVLFHQGTVLRDSAYRPPR